MEHTQECIKAFADWDKAVARYKDLHPNHCFICGGWGYQSSPWCSVSYGATTVSLPDELDPCYLCLECGECPVCGQELSSEPDEDDECGTCDWTWESEDGLPEPPECACWYADVLAKEDDHEPQPGNREMKTLKQRIISNTTDILVITGGGIGLWTMFSLGFAGFLFLAFLSSGAQADEVRTYYQCVDDQGNVTLQDKVCYGGSMRAIQWSVQAPQEGAASTYERDIAFIAGERQKRREAAARKMRNREFERSMRGPVDMSKYAKRILDRELKLEARELRRQKNGGIAQGLELQSLQLQRHQLRR